MFIGYASHSEGPFDICGRRLLVWLFLWIDFLGKPVNHRLKHVLMFLPALKAAKIVKFMALIDRRRRIWMIRDINFRLTFLLKSSYLRF